MTKKLRLNIRPWHRKVLFLVLALIALTMPFVQYWLALGLLNSGPTPYNWHMAKVDVVYSYARQTEEARLLPLMERLDELDREHGRIGALYAVGFGQRRIDRATGHTTIRLETERGPNKTPFLEEITFDSDRNIVDVQIHPRQN